MSDRRDPGTSPGPGGAIAEGVAAPPRRLPRRTTGLPRAASAGREHAVALVQRIPRAGRACFLIAFVNVLIWTFVIPPFLVPDEMSHFAYTQYLVEKGAPPPQGPVGQYSPQELQALGALSFFSTIGQPNQRGVMNALENRGLHEVTNSGASPVGEGGSSSATSEPPLYYGLEAIPYLISPSHEILARLELMRVLSALLSAFTVLCIFMFLREVMPGTPWAWTVGALVVAFAPQFCFIGAGVQGDNLLYLASAATFLGLARAYRRGLTYKRGLFIGLALAVGMLAKLTFLALLPGAFLALLVLAVRGWRSDRIRTLLSAGLAFMVAALPMVIYVILNTAIWHRAADAGGIAGATTAPVGHPINIRESLVYTWQLFLPRLPFMNQQFGYIPLLTTWIDGFVGQFGWLEYGFPAWVYSVARWIVAALAALVIVAVIRLRRSIRPWIWLALCYAVMLVGLVGAIGFAGIRYRAATGNIFEQARYLFPMLALYGLLMVLAARALPRRWAPLLGGALVVLAMTHGLFAETITISRYYG